jgi:hypothetical protein
MGLLDEAIKEHLELKRRRGADPTDIEREEREALGPVRRIAEEGPGGEDTERESEEAHDEGESAPPTHDVFDDQPGIEDHGFGDEEGLEEDTAPHSVVPRSDPVESEEPAGESGAVSLGYEKPVSPAYEDDDGPETAEYDVEAGHHEGEDDDMLEETPEFLQDAPEHDRLWFEQRPPRDFDFDG